MKVEILCSISKSSGHVPTKGHLKIYDIMSLDEIWRHSQAILGMFPVHVPFIVN